MAAAGATLSVSAGHVEAGADADVKVEHSGGEVPAGIRVWVGLESRVGSLKAKAHTHGGEFHALVEVPEKLDSDARLRSPLTATPRLRASPFRARTTIERR